MSSAPIDVTPPAGAPAGAPASAWTCPFCPLLCDRYALAPAGAHWALQGSDCPRATAALQHFGVAPSTAQARIGGQPVALDAAIEQAAQILAASRQPLFGGLATDVSGARALYPLAVATGAICDPAGGAALLHSLRTLQDRGGFTTSLSEVRNRADVIVCLGGSPGARYPELWRRLGLTGEVGAPLVAQRHVAFVGAPVDPALDGLAGLTAASVPVDGDLFDAVSVLAALVANRRVPDAPDALRALAARLQAATYAVIVWEAGRLPAQGALIAETVNLVVAALNRTVRAAALPLGGDDGLLSVQHTFSWLSGLPLRSRAGPLGLEHEPVRFDAQRLLHDGSIDALLWISSFGPEPTAPATQVPSIVLGHPESAVPQGDGRSVFIPVATPGIGAGGHLFRVDGVVTLPLEPVRADTLPTTPDVLARLTARVRALQQHEVAA